MRFRVTGIPMVPADCLVINKARLRELCQLCHPDRHGQSALAIKVFQRLQEVSKLLDTAPSGMIQFVIHTNEERSK